MQKSDAKIIHGKTFAKDFTIRNVLLVVPVYPQQKTEWINWTLTKTYTRTVLLAMFGLAWILFQIHLYLNNTFSHIFIQISVRIPGQQNQHGTLRYTPDRATKYRVGQKSV